MRKLSMLAAAVMAAALFTGCASFQVTKANELSGEKLSTSGTPIAHLNADNWGLYLFMIPLITGSSDEAGKTVFLQDTVNVEKMAPMVAAKSKELGASKTLNMISRTQATGWMFYFKEVQISANAVK